MRNRTGDDVPRNTSSLSGPSSAPVDVAVFPDRADLVPRWRWRPLVFAAAAFVALTFAGIWVLQANSAPGTNATWAAAATLPADPSPSPTPMHPPRR